MGNACCGDDHTKSGATYEEPLSAPALALHEHELDCPDGQLLRVLIVGAQGLSTLEDQSSTGKRRVYCTCQVQGREDSKVTTACQDIEQGPNWWQEFEIHDWAAGDGLEFAVFAWDKSEPLSKAVLAPDQVQAGFAGQLLLLGAKEPGAYLTVKASSEGEYPPMTDEPAEAHAKSNEYQITLRKDAAEDKIGIDIVPQDDTCLRVKRIKDGLIFTWNQEHQEATGVRSGDLIVEVNGARGNVQEILARIAKDSELRIRLVRPER